MKKILYLVKYILLKILPDAVTDKFRKHNSQNYLNTLEALNATLSVYRIDLETFDSSEITRFIDYKVFGTVPPTATEYVSFQDVEFIDKIVEVLVDKEVLLYEEYKKLGFKIEFDFQLKMIESGAIK